MIDERLYIDGNLVDTAGYTNITLSLKSNLFRGISNIKSNSTLSIKLPKTVRNKSIMGYADVVESDTVFPYRYHEARFVRNGVEIIKDGKAVLLSVSDTHFEIAITWGLLPKMGKVLEDGMTLNELNTTETIGFNRANFPAMFDSVLYGAFYAAYNVFDTDTNIGFSWRSKSEVVRPYGFVLHDKAGGEQGGYKDVLSYEYLHPVVGVPYILDNIFFKTGVNFDFTAVENEINKLAIPIINKKANRLTFDTDFYADILRQNEYPNKIVTFRVRKSSNMFNASNGDETTKLTALSSGNIYFDVNYTWEFELERYSPTGQEEIGGFVYDEYKFKGCYLVKIILKESGETNTLDVGSADGFKILVPNGYKGKVRCSTSGSGKVEIKQGCTVEMRWVPGNIFAYSLSPAILGGSVKMKIEAGEEVPYGSRFPISENLPKIKIVDFIKFLSVITGTFPLQVSSEKKIVFKPISLIWENRSQAYDWSNRVLYTDEACKPDDISFSMKDYAQHSLYKWKEDEKTKGNYDGDLTIDNDTLEREKVIFEFPFAATDGNTIPMYTLPEEENDDTRQEARYSACKDRIMRIRRGKRGFAEAVFDMNMQDILQEKYRLIKSSLNNLRIIKLKVRLKDYELLDFDETIPIYLSQYGAYFAVTEIQSDSYGIASVTLLQIKSDE